MRSSIARANERLDPRQQLANTPPPQSSTPGFHPVSIHQMAPLERTSDCSLLLIYRSRKDERLSWPGWLPCSDNCFSSSHIVCTLKSEFEFVASTANNRQRKAYVFGSSDRPCRSLSPVCVTRYLDGFQWNSQRIINMWAGLAVKVFNIRGQRSRS